MNSLYDTLFEYSETDAYPLHMPGHKRCLEGDLLSDVSRIDITEIDGFDNLHDANGILADAQERAASVYGARKSFFLINGSTAGILSAIAACTRPGGWILMARNCHKSAYNAVMLGNLKAHYIYPTLVEDFSFYAGISLNDVQKSMNEFEKIHPQEKLSAVIITSPTYEGVVSDVGEIAEYLHAKKIPLIVDEAHGAHFGFVPEVPENSCRNHADIVIHSLHKTMPSMTQTALLHLNSDLVEEKRLRRYLSTYQTSSPSYVLMASIDRALTMMQENGEEYFREFFYRRKALLKALQECKVLKIYDNPFSDPCKLVIATGESGWSGKKLYDELRLEYALQPEMALGDYVVAILTVMDTKQGFERLKEALLAIDNKMQRVEKTLGMENKNLISFDVSHPNAVCTIGEALDSAQMQISLKEAAGHVSGDFIYVYPPGIPILTPGEEIRQEHVDYLGEIISQGFDLKGVSESATIAVLIEQMF